MPPRRTSVAIARATAVAARAAATAPMTVAAIEQLIKERVSATLANHETLRNSTNSHGDGSHNSDTGIRGTVRTPRECTYKDFLNYKPLTFKGTEGVVVLSQWFKKMESVLHIKTVLWRNKLSFLHALFPWKCLTCWNSHRKTVTHDVAYAIDWKGTKKMMTVKYYPRELALMCGRMFHEESEEVEKYVSGLPYMIRGNDESLHEAWTHFKDLLKRVPRHGIDHLLQVQIFYDHIERTTQMAADFATSDNIRELSAEEAW
ncbi:hypothetical protein Tco_1041316 [Tanacetum coccineum]|uniref:Retrotransposon gag domain-containing protein n=1 Tax=Tanacetum coccineum TaxID=301880 RepID=A0ABQ5GH89_9ASTR